MGKSCGTGTCNITCSPWRAEVHTGTALYMFNTSAFKQKKTMLFLEAEVVVDYAYSFLSQDALKGQYPVLFQFYFNFHTSGKQTPEGSIGWYTCHYSCFVNCLCTPQFNSYFDKFNWKHLF